MIQIFKQIFIYVISKKGFGATFYYCFSSRKCQFARGQRSFELFKFLITHYSCENLSCFSCASSAMFANSSHCDEANLLLRASWVTAMVSFEFGVETAVSAAGWVKESMIALGTLADETRNRRSPVELESGATISETPASFRASFGLRWLPLGVLGHQRRVSFVGAHDALANWSKGIVAFDFHTWNFKFWQENFQFQKSRPKQVKRSKVDCD